MTSKVFISYSWSSPEHKKWVISLVERLVKKGIDVVFDEWDLKIGHNKYVFMESMIKSEEVNKVLIILDEKYTNKANERGGGVGTETMIISPNIYENAKQEKFIPIVTEVDSNGNAFLPIYLNGIIYIDFSEKEKFDEKFEILVKTIKDQPIAVKPKLDDLSSKILNEGQIVYKSSSIINEFDYQIDRNPKKLDILIKNFTDAFFNDLKGFKISHVPNDYLEAGKVILENLNRYTELRDNYIEFFQKISSDYNDWNNDILIDLFENLSTLFYPEEIKSYYPSDFDNFKFIVLELFIYTITIFLEAEQFDVLDCLFSSKYLVKEHIASELKPQDYTYFNNHLDWLKQYLEKLPGFSLQDAVADMLIKRVSPSINKNSLINGDLLCFYIAPLSNLYWFPKTLNYKNLYDNRFPLFNKLVSKRHFEKVKSIFQVETIEELHVKFMIINDSIEKHNYLYRNVRLKDLIKIDNIGTSN